MIRGDLLENKEKSKFFDFEIPIIPAVNNSNSFNKLKEWIGEENSLNLKFLRNVCLYIDDMRLLKNIFNDFVFYENRLNNGIHLDNDKLFAMMIYKNIFPKDFSELQFERGFVHCLFRNKSFYITDKVESIDAKLRARQLSEGDAEHEKDNVKNMTLSQVLDEKGWEEYIRNFFDVKKYGYIKNSYYYDLLKYLLKEGIIDENYSDYISYFYSNDITNNDKKFLRSLTDSVSLDFSYSLKKPELVLDYLDESDFDKIEIINLDLINYVSKNKINLFQKAIKLIKRENNILFLVKFLQCRDLDKKTIIPLILEIWPSCCFEALNVEVQFSKQEFKYFVFTILSYVEDSMVDVLNIDDKLKNYLENMDQLYSYLSDDFDIGKIENALSKFNVEINNLNFSEINEQIAKYVYENCLYSLNFNNINNAYKKYYQKEDDLRDFSDIYLQDTPLKEYIELNINEVIDVLKNNLQFKDHEKVALQILNLTELDDDHAEIYIKKVQVQIDEITKVKTRFWKILIASEKIKYTSFNIVEYYKKFGFDEYISKFINSNDKIIELDDNLDENIQINILKQLLSNKIICIEKVEEFFGKLNNKNIELNVSGLDEEKMKLAIKYNNFGANLNNLRFLRANYSKNLLFYYIEKNISAYVEFMNQSNASKDELQFILNSKSINQEDKINVIKKMSLKLSVTDNRFDHDVNKYILKNHNLYLEDKDKKELFSRYSEYEIYDKEILEIAKDYVTNIMQKTIYIDKRLRTDLLSSSISDSYKQMLLKQSIEKDDAEMVYKNLSTMGYNKLKNIFKKNKRFNNIEKSTEIEELLGLLKKREFIIDFELVDNKYQITKNKEFSID